MVVVVVGIFVVVVVVTVDAVVVVVTVVIIVIIMILLLFSLFHHRHSALLLYLSFWSRTNSFNSYLNFFLSSTLSNQRLAEVAHSLLKLAPYDPPTLGCKGLRTYMTEMLPLTDWSVEAVRPSINLVLRRLDRMFNKIYKQTSLRFEILLIPLLTNSIASNF